MIFYSSRNCLIKQPQEEDPDEGVKDLVEIALRKLDIDKDGKVSFQDYARYICQNMKVFQTSESFHYH
jgi:hypothetical protein